LVDVISDLQPNKRATVNVAGLAIYSSWFLDQKCRIVTGESARPCKSCRVAKRRATITKNYTVKSHVIQGSQVGDLEY
jgi:hypothetical protein